MKEQELRDKIIGIVLDVPITGIKIRGILGGEATANAIANALISEGIGDVKEAEHRAERAEKALEKFAENITCEDCPYFSDCASSEKMEDLIHSDYCFAEYLRQAERELQEEKKE